MGFCECKDIDKELAVLLTDKKIGEQLDRYRAAADNLIFSNYRDFLLFQAGSREPVAEVHLGPPGRLGANRNNAEALARLFELFIAYRPEVTATPAELAIALAKRAHILRDQVLIRLIQDKPTGQGPLVPLYKAFSEFLIKGMTDKEFSDAYAQSVAYGLFMARAIQGTGEFSRTMARDLLPETFHLVKTLFNHISGEIPADLEWVVDSMAETLAVADLGSILSAFTRRESEEDPFMHFYETFLAEFDPEARERRGVYFTPRPVVSFIVNSVNHLLKTRFDKARGLADSSVTVLDPALGTGTFLEQAIRVAREENEEAGLGGRFRDMVREHILSNFYGFELLVAPYTIAHVKLSMTLSELGYRLGPGERLKVFLTNTLDPQIIQPALFPLINDLSAESQVANKVKTETPILVITGNPPYSGTSANQDPWIDGLLRGNLPNNNNAKLDSYYEVDGKPLGERQLRWLQDDYVKFIRFGQWKIDRAGQGILAFITNHAYLNNLTFRGMRQSLLNSFTDIYILNLHGNFMRRERCPDGSRDENVFDIQLGVAIGIFVKEEGKKGPAKVHYADLWGTRDRKYGFLGANFVGSVSWTDLKPESSNYSFVPRDETLMKEYKKFWSIKDIFPVNSVGIVTGRDRLTIQYSADEVWRVVNDFVLLDPEEAREKYKLGKDTSNWRVAFAQEDLRKTGLDKRHITQILYRPFDIRYTYYTGHSGGFIVRPLYKIMRHMLARENLALITTRQVNQSEFRHVFCADGLIDMCTVSLQTREGSYLFSLYLYFDSKGLPLERPFPNLSQEFLRLIKERTGAERSPEEIFYYIYGVLYTPAYRERYSEFLRYDFPRIPVFDASVFEDVSALGKELVELHLCKRRLTPRVKYPVSGDHIVRKVSYNEPDKRVWINDSQYFEGVEPEAWEYHIGGYRVLNKLLDGYKKRGKALTTEMVEHFQQVHEILLETINLQKKLDEAWPLG